MPPAAGSSPKRRQIPGTSVLQWQSSETHTPRRPMTACKACRLAKAKCNGQQNCERCRSRGLRCTYSRPSSGARNGNSKNKSPASQTPTGAFPLNGQEIAASTTPDPMSVDGPDNLFSMSNHAGSTSQSTANPMDSWREETFQQALEEFNWVFPEPEFSLNPSDDPNRNDFGLFPPTRSENSDLSESQPEATGPSSQNQPTSQVQPTLHNCQCRTNMMLQVPKLESAIQEKQLDTMFKVTGDVIRSCQESTNCGCHVNPVDLVCIMAVFEQTAACFDYIAKSGFGGTVKVGIGAYCISLTDDASLKRMLVVDLIKQANLLLDSLCALAEDMFMSRSKCGIKVMNRSPACLNQLNRDYVREAAASFKKLFYLMTGMFDEKDDCS